MIQVKYIIVGRGLGGTVLAHTFLQNNKSFVIIDEPSLSNASKIAAGLYNPVVFKRLSKSWMADKLLPFMDSYYHTAEQLLQQKFYFKKNIVKLFTEEQEKTLWLKKSKEDMGIYLDEKIEDNFSNEIIHSNNGAAQVIQSGYLNIADFLEHFKHYFLKHNLLIEERFDYNQLILKAESVDYKNIRAEKIIFCEGYRALENPYFKWLPLKLTKGEVITIKCPQLQQPNKVINKGVFVLPIGNDHYRVGATYEWNELTPDTTPAGRQELIDKLKKVLKVDFEIIDHKAGIRPTVAHRRPLLGLHPQYKTMAVFNGLGTKGVMLAPYFAKQLYDFLELNTLLSEDVTIEKYFKE